jgi:anti-anti-sigma factor
VSGRLPNRARIRYQPSGVLDDQAFAFAVGLQGPYAVVEAAGELDIAAIPELRAGARRAAARAESVVVDLRAVSFLDTFALRALVALQRETMDRPGRTFHAVPGDRVQRVLDLSDMREDVRWISSEQLPG